MNIERIAALAASGESETLEFKETTGTRREAAMTVCAFLNQGGGLVLFGVTPDGAVVGQQVSERTIEELSAELRQIDPPAFPTVERVPVDGGREVIVVSTAQGASRPYSYRGTAYRRVGNTTLAMSADEYNRMLFERMHSEQRWENQPAVGWSVDDLDAAEIRRTVAEAVRRGRLEEPVSGEPTDLLRGLGLLRDGVLLRAAAVLFGGAERLEFEMPQCLLRVARFRGTRPDGVPGQPPVQRQRLHATSERGALPARHPAHSWAVRAGPLRANRRSPCIRHLATREALANALCHRDYSIGGGSVGIAVYDDRLEIYLLRSPCTSVLTPEKLFVPSRVAAVEPVDRPHLLPSRDH